jgi:hypothetical protein
MCVCVLVQHIHTHTRTHAHTHMHTLTPNIYTAYCDTDTWPFFGFVRVWFGLQTERDERAERDSEREREIIGPA